MLPRNKRRSWQVNDVIIFTPNLYTPTTLCYHFVTTLLPACYHLVTTLLPPCYHFVTNVTNIFNVTTCYQCYHCYHYVINKRHPCKMHKKIMLSLVIIFVIIMLSFLLSLFFKDLLRSLRNFEEFEYFLRRF